MSKIDFLDNHFKLPIFYNKHKMELKDNIITDLELIQTHDSSNSPIYHFLFHNPNLFSEEVIKQISKTYTNDTTFLNDSQKLFKNYQKKSNIENKPKVSVEQIYELWNEIKEDTGFKERYYYIDWPMWEYLNKSEFFLQFMSIYNMTSPVISLSTPIIILIIPFFIIKLKGLHLTINEYIDVIKHIISNHAIGKLGTLFTNFHSVSNEQKIYIITSVAFYIFSIYQNVLTCIRFNNNMITIHESLNTIEQYIFETVESMNHFLHYSCTLESYSEFNETLQKNCSILNDFREKIKGFGKYKLSVKKISEIGQILKYFYEIFDSQILNDSFLYSFGFNGYIYCIESLIENIQHGYIHFTRFTKKKGKNVLKKNYYAPLIHSKPVKNTIQLRKNIIITGPNASGKTTILKSTLINIILSQQFGCGFYDSAVLYPYKYIHCYLNIPDTSGRDSLFQAEVRRCKEILDLIHNESDETHFCVFDELYSGTNPDEAIISSIAFMSYLVKFKKINCLLTTHFTQVCKILDSNLKIVNYHMDVTDSKYNYLLKYGFSEVKGGIKVLQDMNYPKEIIDAANKYL